MNLHFRVKLFYTQYIEKIAAKNVEVKIPDYCAWFEPFVMNWLNDNDDISMEYLHNAYDKDKDSHFQKTSEHAIFSSSVVDVFTQLNQCYDVIKKLECPNEDVQNHYLSRFALSISRVLLGYANLVRREFADYSKEVTALFFYLKKFIQLVFNLNLK
jgi:protein unc-13 A/B/C